MSIPGANKAIRTFLRGDSAMKLSSLDLGWSRVALEEHQASPREIPETSIDSILLMLWQGNSNARGEHTSSGGSFVSYKKRPGTMTLYPSGSVPAARTSTASDLLFCAIDKKFFFNISEQIRDERRSRIRGAQLGVALDEPIFYDPHLSQLLLLLRDEVKSGGESGPLYAEHLTHALSARLAFITSTGTSIGPEPLETLSAKTLSLIIDRMEAEPLACPGIESLAAEAGYSYNRFLRAFRSSTGFSPHQYLLHLRLTQAKNLMHNRSWTLLEIALECGFASHAHLSHAFRKRYGMSPSEFRSGL